VSRIKAIVLCGGRGDRLRPLTGRIPKQLLPVANKPVIQYALEKITKAGISEIGIIVSPDSEALIKEALGSSFGGASLSYIVQEAPLGLAQSVETARGFLGESPFVMFLGDNIIEAEIDFLLNRFERSGSDAHILLKEVANPSAFGVAELDEAGKVVRLVEKPKEPESNLAVVGVYMFTAAIHKATGKLKPSWRGELEITDAIQQLITDGGKVHSTMLDGFWYDVGTKEDLLKANREILNRYGKSRILGRMDEASSFSRQVEIGEGTVLENTAFTGPVVIGRGCRLSHCRIGPFTSIGDECTIISSSLRDSIVLAGSHISKRRQITGKLVYGDIEI